MRERNASLFLKKKKKNTSNFHFLEISVRDSTDSVMRVNPYLRRRRYTIFNLTRLFEARRARRPIKIQKCVT